MTESRPPSLVDDLPLPSSPLFTFGKVVENAYSFAKLTGPANAVRHRRRNSSDAGQCQRG